MDISHIFCNNFCKTVNLPTLNVAYLDASHPASRSANIDHNLPAHNAAYMDVFHVAYNSTI